MVNYVEIIGEFFVGTHVSCLGDPTIYANINWDGTPIPEEDLLVAALAAAKTDRIIALSVNAEDHIINGFPSDAVNIGGWYDSEPEDQLNLIGSVASGDDMYYAVRDGFGGPKTYAMHTALQLQQVLQDGRTIKLETLIKFNTKKEVVLAATTIDGVNLITWDSVE